MTAVYDSPAWLALQHRIEALEEAQVKQATDLVKALSDLSAELRQWGRDIDNDDRRQGYMACAREAAIRIDELNTGLVMQATLDALDARTPE
jgi:hypothetical protein